MNGGTEQILDLQHGDYALVVAHRNGGPDAQKKNLYQYVAELSPDIRRRLFVVLLGEEFRTGDGNQAFAAMADLVVHPNDARNADALIQNTTAERLRLYQVFLEAETKRQEGKL